MTRDPDEVYIQVRRDRRSPVQALPETAKNPTPAQIEQRLRFAAAAKLSRGLRRDEQRRFVGELIRGPVSAPHRVQEPKWKQRLRRRYSSVLEQERRTPDEGRHFTDEQLDKIARALGGGP